MKVRNTIALLSLAFSLSAFAADPALKQLDVFVGDWKCSGTQTFNGPTIHYTATVHSAWILDGNWLDTRVTQNKTKENAHPFNGRAYMGYDPAAKKFLTGWIDNTGGYETATFDGWQGDTLTFDGNVHMGTMTMKGRDTFTKSGRNKLTHVYELEQDGKWTEVMRETCTK